MLRQLAAHTRPYISPHLPQVLRQLAAHTRLDERRHPEDFSGRWAGCLRGLWGVPPRNPQFVGREAELAQTDAAMARATAGAGRGGLTTLELVGMGGVGKTQLAVEYCYRHLGALGEAPAPG